MFLHVVEASVDIAAPRSVVFEVLTRNDDWHTWSTMLVSLKPTPIALGAQLSLGLRTPQASYDFTAQVTAFDPEKTFEWLAKTGISGVMDGRHRFELSDLPGVGCRLRNVEFYTGLLVPIIKRTASMQAAPKGFAQMNAEIARRAETLAPRLRTEE